MVWDTVQGEDGLVCGWCACIAGQPLCPRKPVMGTLGARKDRLGRVWDGQAGQIHLDSLLTKQLHTCTALCSPWPISPEQWG